MEYAIGTLLTLLSPLPQSIRALNAELNWIVGGHDRHDVEQLLARLAVTEPDLCFHIRRYDKGGATVEVSRGSWERVEKLADSFYDRHIVV